MMQHEPTRKGLEREMGEREKGSDRINSYEFRQPLSDFILVYCNEKAYVCVLVLGTTRNRD